MNERELRIAWIIPALDRSCRWQPVLREFAKLVPKTRIFGASWPGFLPSCDNSFSVAPLRGARHIRFGLTPSGSIRGFWWYSPLVALDWWRYDPTVMVVNGFGICTGYAILYKLLFGARVVLLWQGMSPESGGEPGSLRYFLRRAMSSFLDVALTNTEAGRRYLTRTIGMADKRVLKKVFEVADDRGSQCSGRCTELFVSLRKPVFLFAGKVIRGKGVHVLLHAAGLLRDRGLEFSIGIVGNGSHRDELRQLATTLRLDGIVHWYEAVPFNDLPSYYQACDAFVLPSLEDTWGVVAVEAMACGKPVLCSAAAGVHEIVEDGLNGFVFPADDPDALAAAMQRLICAPELLARMGEESRRIARAHSPSTSARQLYEAMRPLVQPIVQPTIPRLQ